MGRLLAMLIATYAYQDSTLRQLTAPAHDADALAAVLRDPAIAGFEVTILVNKPHQLVGEAIGDFYRDRRRDDLTLLYFTGHGLKDDDGRLYLAMANTRHDNLLFTGLPAEQIDQAMEGCVSRQKVLVLDCCYSGAFPVGRISKGDTAVHTLERFHGRGRTVLTASDATQYSFEGNQAHGQAAQSVFTRYLVEGLREGSADLDCDGDITLDELYSYVHDRVVDEMPQQRPKKQDNVEGRIVIARNINWKLPAHLRHALDSPIATARLGAVDGLAHLHRIGNDLVRRRVLDELQRLVEDDSRRVSAAATARLQTILPPPPDLSVDEAAGPGTTTTPTAEQAVAAAEKRAEEAEKRAEEAEKRAAAAEGSWTSDGAFIPPAGTPAMPLARLTTHQQVEVIADIMKIHRVHDIIQALMFVKRHGSRAQHERFLAARFDASPAVTDELRNLVHRQRLMTIHNWFRNAARKSDTAPADVAEEVIRQLQKAHHHFRQDHLPRMSSSFPCRVCDADGASAGIWACTNCGVFNATQGDHVRGLSNGEQTLLCRGTRGLRLCEDRTCQVQLVAAGIGDGFCPGCRSPLCLMTP